MFARRKQLFDHWLAFGQHGDITKRHTHVIGGPTVMNYRIHRDVDHLGVDLITAEDQFKSTGKIYKVEIENYICFLYPSNRLISRSVAWRSQVKFMIGRKTSRRFHIGDHTCPKQLS